MQRRVYSMEDALPICLYCKQSDVPFTSVEHVIPESLGNQGLGINPPIVLPKGVVCDKCNHGKLAILDNALIDFSPISLMRTRFGVRSKSGELPSTKLGNARLRSLAPGDVLIEPGSSEKAFQFDRGKGRFSMQLLSNRPMTPTYCRTITQGPLQDDPRVHVHRPAKNGPLREVRSGSPHDPGPGFFSWLSRRGEQGQAPYFQ